MLGVFQIPDALSEDTVRISVQHGDGFDLLKTFAHTQGNVDYINNSAYDVNITGLMDWTWQDVSDMVFTLDYVSAGGVDDSRLVVDALGLEITVRTPWYGGEVGFASSEFSGHAMPVMGMDLTTGTTDNLALDACGLKADRRRHVRSVDERRVFTILPNKRWDAFTKRSARAALMISPLSSPALKTVQPTLHSKRSCPRRFCRLRKAISCATPSRTDASNPCGLT